MGVKIFQNEPDPKAWNDPDAPQQSTAEEEAQANFDLAFSNSYLTKAQREYSYEKLKAQGGKILTANELNEKYGHTGLIFKEPANEFVAEEQARWQQYQNSLNETAGLGPGGLVLGAKSLGWGFTAQMSDPINMAMMTGTAALTGGLGLTSAVGRYALTTSTIGLMQASTDTYFKKRELRDVTAGEFATDFATNVAMDIAFDGLLLGAKAGWNKSRDWFRRGSDYADSDSLAAAINQANAGKRVNVGYLEDLFRREREGFFDDGPDSPFGGDHSGRSRRSGRVDPDGNTSGRFYHSSRSDTIELKPGVDYSVSPFEDDFGVGIYLTDSAFKANNISGSKFKELPENIIQIDIKAAKLADTTIVNRELFTRIKEGLVKSLESDIDRAIIVSKLDSGASLKEILDEVKNDVSPETSSKILAALNKEVADAGYDGYILNREGANDIMIFDSSVAKLSQSGVFDPDHSAIPDLNKIPDEINSSYQAKMNAPESDVMYSKEISDSADILMKQVETELPMQQRTEVELKSILDSVNSEIDILKEIHDKNQALMDELFSRRASDISNIEAVKNIMPNTKVVDTNGNPLRVYHGTEASFKEFDLKKVETAIFGNGFYFADDPKVADVYARAEGGNVRPVYLNIENPFYWTTTRLITDDQKQVIDFIENHVTTDELGKRYGDALDSVGYESIRNGSDRFIKAIEAWGRMNGIPRSEMIREAMIGAGFDGVIVPDSGYYVAFDKSQVVSSLEPVKPHEGIPFKSEEAGSIKTSDEIRKENINKSVFEKLITCIGGTNV